MNQLKSEHSIEHWPLWTALVTPFNASQQIDFDSLKHIALKQADANNAILLLGSTGEGLALTAEEQFSIVEFVSQLNLPVPLMVAVGGFQLPEQIAWIERCNALNIDAYLLGSPLYSKPGAVGQQQWFEALLNKSAHPCMLYNVPSRSGVSLSVTALAAMQDHPRCWALKEASGDIAQFSIYREKCPNIALYSGEDGLMSSLAKVGAKGLVSVAANAWPKQTNSYVQRCLNSDSADLQGSWKQAIDSLFSVANPIPVKILMEKNGDIAEASLRLPLTVDELASHSALLSANNTVNAWYEQSLNARNLETTSTYTV